MRKGEPRIFLAPRMVSGIDFCDTVPALSSAACGQRVLLSGEEWNALPPGMVSLAASQSQCTRQAVPPVRKVVDAQNVAFEKVDWGAADERRIVLPALTLSLAYSGTYVRLIRSAMVRTADEDWVVFARSRGLSEGRITLRILVNSLASSITALGISIPKLMAGAFVVENIFARPGLGRLCVTAIFNRDLPVVEAYVLVMAALFAGFDELGRGKLHQRAAG